MEFDFDWEAVHRAIDDVVQTDDNGCIGNVFDNGGAVETSAGGYDHTRVNRTFHRGKSLVTM